jgi:hypothetical protein
MVKFEESSRFFYQNPKSELGWIGETHVDDSKAQGYIIGQI